MSPHVFFKVLRLPAALPTHTTLKRSLISVHPQMYLIVPTMRKRLIANLTLVRHISRVRFHMSAQFGSGGEHLIASRTLPAGLLTLRLLAPFNATLLFFLIFRDLFHGLLLRLLDYLLVMGQRLRLSRDRHGGRHHLIMENICGLHLLNGHRVASVVHLHGRHGLYAVAVQRDVVLRLYVVVQLGGLDETVLILHVDERGALHVQAIVRLRHFQLLSHLVDVLGQRFRLWRRWLLDL